MIPHLILVDFRLDHQTECLICFGRSGSLCHCFAFNRNIRHGLKMTCLSIASVPLQLPTAVPKSNAVDGRNLKSTNCLVVYWHWIKMYNSRNYSERSRQDISDKKTYQMKEFLSFGRCSLLISTIQSVMRRFRKRLSTSHAECNRAVRPKDKTLQ